MMIPRQGADDPVPEQYASTAHEYGLSKDITPDAVKAAFKETFRAQMKRYPNYGRADVLRGRYGGPKQWLEEVMHGSFSLCAGNPDSRDLPSGLLDALLKRFAGAEGHALFEDVEPFFARIRNPLAA
ncbi:unnamed protein product [Penicillium glandicola]